VIPASLVLQLLDGELLVLGELGPDMDQSVAVCAIKLK